MSIKYFFSFFAQPSQTKQQSSPGYVEITQSQTRAPSNDGYEQVSDDENAITQDDSYDRLGKEEDDRYEQVSDDDDISFKESEINRYDSVCEEKFVSSIQNHYEKEIGPEHVKELEGQYEVEPYFTPASEEKEVMTQIENKLQVNVIPKEEVTYVMSQRYQPCLLMIVHRSCEIWLKFYIE